MATLSLCPVLNLEVPERTEVFRVRGDEDELVRVRDGRDLPVSERRRGPEDIQPSTLGTVPCSGSFVLCENGEGCVHDIAQKSFERTTTARIRQSPITRPHTPGHPHDNHHADEHPAP